MNTWIGIDEAGYGPNLGPLVMAAVIAQSPDDREPDLWGDLASTISRARGPSERLWVDDSKQILKGGKGRDRLDQAAFATLQAAGIELPATYSSWLIRVLKGTAFADRDSLLNGKPVDVLAAWAAAHPGVEMAADVGWTPTLFMPMDAAADVAAKVRAGAGKR